MPRMASFFSGFIQWRSEGEISGEDQRARVTITDSRVQKSIIRLRSMS